MTIKKCSKCNEELPIEMFEITCKKDKMYYRHKCKKCRLQETHEQREKRKKNNKVEITNKICIKCNETLDITHFYKQCLTIDGYNNQCKKCLKNERIKRNITNTDIGSDNKDIYCKKCKIYKSTLEFRKTARSKTCYYNTCNSCWKPTIWNKEKQKQAELKYVKNNPDKIKEKNKKQSQKLERKIKGRIQGRIRDALKSVNTRKSNPTYKYLGCDIQYFKKWLEFQFTDNINWNNMNEWHIDHITPCIEYDLTNEEQQKICFNWQNLRPCLAKENLEKSNKIIQTLIDSQKQLVLKFLEINPLPTRPGDRVEGAE